jgi:hypothetical protein
MSFFGAVRLLVTTWRQPHGPAADGDLPEIRRGAWAAHAHAEAGGRARRAGLGDACRTGARREGRLVEIIERGRSVLVCQEIRPGGPP